MKNVYHASHQSRLTILEPRKSTHGQSWVYATIDKIMTAVFMGRFGDFSCSTGRGDDGKVFICERFPGAFGSAYNNSASIYTLAGDGFNKGYTGWKEEVVSPNPVVPSSEEKVSNAADYLQELEKQGKINIYRYPNRPSYIPNDDEDLVQKAVEWIRGGNDKIIGQIKKYHPKLLSRVESALNINVNL